MRNIEEIIELVSDCKYNDWTFVVFLDGNRPCLQLQWDDTCNVTGEPYLCKSRKWFLSYHMTRSEIVSTAFKAVITAMEHETREQFKWKGEPVFRPHLDIDDLYALSKENKVDKRDDAA